MKRQIYFSVLIILATGCTGSEELGLQDVVDPKEATITASFADSKTRTVLSEDGGTSVYWEAGDEIAVFSGAEGSKFTSTLTEPAAVSTFTGTMPADGGEKFLALYPYSSDAVSDGESITTTLPNEQTARAGSFAKNLNLSLAESDSYSMSFYNVCGGLCFKLTTEGIKKITIKSNNGESLAGSVKLAFEDGIPAVKEITDGKDTITLTAPDNGTFATGVWYYIVTFPTTLANGLQMTFKSDTKPYSQTATLTSSSSLALKRHIFTRASDIDSGLAWKNEGTIIFADDVVKQACVAKFDTNKDGEISFDEASAVTDISGLFDSYKTITSFDEFQYFDHITELSTGLFENCTSLKSVSIPSSVTSLGERCFSDCTSLTSIEIPSSVTSLGNGCFYGCSGLTSIEIPSSVTSLGDYCFNKCTSLTSIEIPSSVTSLGYSCFYKCTSLTSIEIPSSVTSLEESCFYGCTSLMSIEIPLSVTSLGEECFSNCTSLANIEIPSSVTSLDSYCFAGCTSLTSIEIPSSVTSLLPGCFSDCTSLTSIEIPSSVTSLGYRCFYGCSGLTSIEIPSSVTSLGKECFSTCTSLTSIEIPSSVTSLGISCFNGCSSLTSIEIPSSVTSLGNGCFYGCSGLTSIEIPSSVTSLGISCFNGCSSLTSVEIPSSVKSLGISCFNGCSSLTSIEIPSSVKSLGESCFSGCTNLSEMHCLAASVPSVGNQAFDGTKASSGYLYVPEESVELYANDSGWKVWKNILKIE